MSYTFDSFLTTDQKLAHLKEWIAAAHAASADGSETPESEQHAERLRLLRLWHRLVQVQEDLAASKADLSNPTPLDDEMQEDWCRAARLELRIAGLRERLATIQRSPLPWYYRPHLVEEKIARFTQRLRSARRALSRSTEYKANNDYCATPCLEWNEHGQACCKDAPCLPCRANAVYESR